MSTTTVGPIVTVFVRPQYLSVKCIKSKQVFRTNYLLCQLNTGQGIQKEILIFAQQLAIVYEKIPRKSDPIKFTESFFKAFNND